MPQRLAVLTDFPEEGWRSMDLCGDMLLSHLPYNGPLAVNSVRLCPEFRRIATRVPAMWRRRAALNADRLLNRFVVFPRHARRAYQLFDMFHVADHSYAALVHELPADRTGVYCHDVDALQCLFDKTANQRPQWFRFMSQRILSGLQKARVVFHNTEAVAAELRRERLVDAERLVHAPLGVAEEFTPATSEPVADLPWLGELAGRPWLLHVGTCNKRKRIDVLLNLFAAARVRIPDLRLVKVGGEWSSEHREQIRRLGIADMITHVCGLTRLELAEVYRRASLVLVPSEAEGFGLPVIEALACGAVVVASDIPALREAGGPAAVYAPVGDVEAWSDVVAKLINHPAAASRPPRVGEPFHLDSPC